MIKLLFQVIVLGLAFYFATPTIAGTILDAERAVGRLGLGMQKREFHRVTGVKAGACPGECKDEEEYADVECSFRPEVCEGVPEVTGFDVFFWKKKIYFMAVGVKKLPLNEVKKRFTKQFGPPTGTFSEGAPGVKVIQWRSKSTEITATYAVTDDKVFVISFKDLTRNTLGAGW